MSKEEKMLVLEMVKDGKITPEQGTELLNALLGSKPALKPPLKSMRGISDDTEGREASIEQAVEKIGELAESRAESLAERITQVFSGGGSRGPRFELSEEFQGELDPEGEIEVDLQSANGVIEVRSWDRSGYRLEVLKKANAETEEEAKKVLEGCFEFTHTGLVLSAIAKERQRLGSRNLSVDFILTLPADRRATVNLHSANGRITVQGISGSRCRAKTANGRIEVLDTKFDVLELNTANGRIAIEDASGKKCTAETMNGRIEARGCKFCDVEMTDMNGRIEYEGESSNMTAKTMNGRIVVELTGTGNWNLKTSNGPIEAKIHKGETDSYEVDLVTNSGAIDVDGMGDVDVLIDERKKHLRTRHYRACNKGFAEAESKGSLKASTSSGRILVEFL